MRYNSKEELLQLAGNMAVKAEQRKSEVSVVIGNGFDIGLGLNTRYSDFLERYLKPEYPVRTEAIRAMKNDIRNQIHNESVSWADAEIAFGQLEFSNYPHKEGGVGALAECEGDFTSALKSYLLDEDSRFIIPPERQNDTTHKFCVQLQNLLESEISFPSYVKTLNVEFFNFNYTSTLDKLLSGDMAALVQTDATANKRNFNLVGVHHIHGSLSHDNIIFGVDDDAQISDQDVADASKQDGYLVKSELDSALQVNELASFIKRISNSNVIVLFGLSYGRSDASIWQSVFRAMKKNHLLDVVLCGYMKDPPVVSGSAMLQKMKAAVRNRFAASIDWANNFDVSEYSNHLHVVGYDFYESPSGYRVYSDPLGLGWFRHEFVRRSVTKGREQVDA